MIPVLRGIATRYGWQVLRSWSEPRAKGRRMYKVWVERTGPESCSLEALDAAARQVGAHAYMSPYVSRFCGGLHYIRITVQEAAE